MMRESQGMPGTMRESKPLRQAFALAYAMRARPTPQLATAYFAALKRVLDTPPAPGKSA